MTAPLTSEEIFEDLADFLESSGDYRVLRRLKPMRPGPDDGRQTWRGVVVDVESTGLDTAADEIVELAMLPFSYDAEGRIVEVGEGWEGLRQPSRPIPPAATAVHGLTDEKVAGRSIDPEDVAAFIAPADLIVAHNAMFDRPLLERYCPAFATKPFACSMTQIPWIAEGHEGLKLGYLAADHGFFHDRHHALNDCRATLELLSRPLRTTGALAMAALLQQTRRPTWRIWAEGAPFDFKDTLKQRGYRWHAGGPGRARAWYIDVDDEDRVDELAYLEREIFGGPRDLIAHRLDARDRFSVRALP